MDKTTSPKSEKKVITLNPSIKKTEIQKISFSTDETKQGKKERKPITFENSDNPKAKRQKITFDSPKERKKITFGNTARSHQRGHRVSPDEEEKEELSLNVLQPELLPLTIMYELLKQRGADISLLEGTTRSETVRLFYKHISPKPQRILKDNRLGKILHKFRKKFTKCEADVSEWEKLVSFKRKKHSLEKEKRIINSHTPEKASSNSPLVSSSTTTSPKSLKSPPVSCIDLGKKKIKISSSSGSSDFNFSVLKRDSSNKIDSEKCKSSPCSDQVKRTSVDQPNIVEKKIKLNRSPSKENSSKNEKEHNGKRATIAWP